MFGLASSATAAPMIGHLGAAAATQGTFAGACNSFLEHLKDHKIIGSLDAKPNMGWSIKAKLKGWGEVIHRLKTVSLTHGPQGLPLQNADGTPMTYTKAQTFSRLHISQEWRV